MSEQAWLHRRENTHEIGHCERLGEIPGAGSLSEQTYEGDIANKAVQSAY